VFAYMRWPRDEPGRAVLARYGATPSAATGGALAPPAARRGLAGPQAAPHAALADQRGWRLTGSLPAGGSVAFAITGSAPNYLLTGAAAAQPTDLSLP